MPFTGFNCHSPICKGRTLSLEDALSHYDVPPDSHHIGVPPAVVELLWRRENDPRRQGTHLSPSMAGGCMREYALLRTLPWTLDPLTMWKATAGTLRHYSLAQAQVPGWLHEVHMPPRSNLTDSNTAVSEMELWPGIWMSGVIDMLRGDYAELWDYKTQACPNGRWDKTAEKIVYTNRAWPPGEQHILQLNIYGRMVIKHYGLSEMPRLGIWRLTEGIQDEKLAWKFWPIEVMPADELQDRVVPPFKMLLMVMGIVNVEERMAAIAEMPLEGREMYNKKKCPRYCNATAKYACDGLLPVMERF